MENSGGQKGLENVKVKIDRQRRLLTLERVRIDRILRHHVIRKTRFSACSIWAVARMLQ